jgi:hypothetical protein
VYILVKVVVNMAVIWWDDMSDGGKQNGRDRKRILRFLVEYTLIEQKW